MGRWALLLILGILAETPAALAAHRRPAGAFEPARLLSLMPTGVRECKELQARVDFTVLCPARLPRAGLHWRHGTTPPKLAIERYGDRSHTRKPGLLGLGFAYGVPVEPASGRWFWSRRTWLNRLAYFLHFTIYRRGLERLPVGLRRRCFGHRCGLARYAEGYGLRADTGYYWANHT